MSIHAVCALLTSGQLLFLGSRYVRADIRRFQESSSQHPAVKKHQQISARTPTGPSGYASLTRPTSVSVSAARLMFFTASAIRASTFIRRPRLTVKVSDFSPAVIRRWLGWVKLLGVRYRLTLFNGHPRNKARTCFTSATSAGIQSMQHAARQADIDAL
jgi:hypothetical protein